MNNLLNTFKQLTVCAVILLVNGCANNGGGMMTNNNPAYGIGGIANNAMGGGLEGALLGSVLQNMAGSVMNGQIGSQLSTADQSFRMQQLGGLVQSGAFGQTQQWSNPQTGNNFSLNPIGQQMIDPQTQHNCQDLQETVVLKNGQTVQENRRACMNPQTGKWNLVQ